MVLIIMMAENAKGYKGPCNHCACDDATGKLTTHEYSFEVRKTSDMTTMTNRTPDLHS